MSLLVDVCCALFVICRCVFSLFVAVGHCLLFVVRCWLIGAVVRFAVCFDVVCGRCRSLFVVC